MRTWGRTYDAAGNATWTEVTATADGQLDYVYMTTLIQCLLLNLNESPFYAQYGIPAKESVMQQVFPDYYVMLTQQTFAPYFASLLISKQQSTTPTYNVNVTTNQGIKLSASVPIAQ